MNMMSNKELYLSIISTPNQRSVKIDGLQIAINLTKVILNEFNTRAIDWYREKAEHTI